LQLWHDQDNRRPWHARPRFRIDDSRNGQAMNMATVSRDLRAQKRAEAALLDLNETGEGRVVARTRELAIFE
jgi:hypothetical protein